MSYDSLKMLLKGEITEAPKMLMIGIKWEGMIMQMKDEF